MGTTGEGENASVIRRDDDRRTSTLSEAAGGPVSRGTHECDHGTHDQESSSKTNTTSGLAASSSTKTSSRDSRGIITIFTISSCPHCRQVKQLFFELQWPFTEISLSDYPHLRADMLQLSNRLTVPQVFFNNYHIGGTSEVTELHETGELKQLYRYFVDESHMEYRDPAPALLTARQVEDRRLRHEAARLGALNNVRMLERQALEHLSEELPGGKKRVVGHGYSRKKKGQEDGEESPHADAAVGNASSSSSSSKSPDCRRSSAVGGSQVRSTSSLSRLPSHGSRSSLGGSRWKPRASKEKKLLQQIGGGISPPSTAVNSQENKKGSIVDSNASSPQSGRLLKRADPPMNLLDTANGLSSPASSLPRASVPPPMLDRECVSPQEEANQLDASIIPRRCATPVAYSSSRQQSIVLTSPISSAAWRLCRSTSDPDSTHNNATGHVTGHATAWQLQGVNASFLPTCASTVSPLHRPKDDDNHSMPPEYSRSCEPHARPGPMTAYGADITTSYYQQNMVVMAGPPPLTSIGLGSLLDLRLRKPDYPPLPDETLLFAKRKEPLLYLGPPGKSVHLSSLDASVADSGFQGEGAEREDSAGRQEGSDKSDLQGNGICREETVILFKDQYKEERRQHSKGGGGEPEEEEEGGRGGGSGGRECDRLRHLYGVKISDLVEWLLQAVDVAPRRHLVKAYKRCFVGADFIDAITTKFGYSRNDAVQIAQSLMDMDMINSVNSAIGYKDCACSYYRLQIHDAPLTLNTAIVYTGKPPTRPVSLLRYLTKLLNQILADHTNESGSVDYVAAQEDNRFLRFVMATCELQQVDLMNRPQNRVLAFTINCYNLLIKHAFVQVGIPNSSLLRHEFFNKVGYCIGGYKFTLNQLESGILRGNRRSPFSLLKPFLFKDQRALLAMRRLDCRIHFALNCGAKSCPPIKLFTEEAIQEELRVVAVAFCEDDKNISVELDTHTVYLSRIINWYSRDFGNNAVDICTRLLTWCSGQKAKDLSSLIEQCNHSLSVATNAVSSTLKASPIGHFSRSLKIKYLPYDWSTNAARSLDFSASNYYKLTNPCGSSAGSC